MIAPPDRLDEQGFGLVPDAAASDDIRELKTLFEIADIARVERGGRTFGARNLLSLPQVRRMAVSPALAVRLLPLLGTGYRVVRGLFFDKTPGANWPVPWHQDLSLAVQTRAELDGWSGWSVKAGVPHVQPPVALLARMVTVRLHLDDCPAENGALRVLPGSHRAGRLSPAMIAASAARIEAQTVTAGAGDALLMRPLLVHASSPARVPCHRRVLHLEFAPADLLPPELSWACQ